jgi:hypothetical protein
MGHRPGRLVLRDLSLDYVKRGGNRPALKLCQSQNLTPRFPERSLGNVRFQLRTFDKPQLSPVVETGSAIELESVDHKIEKQPARSSDSVSMRQWFAQAHPYMVADCN